MSRAAMPARTGPRRAAAPAPELDPACPRNDECQREQARALSRLADVAEAAHAELLMLKPTLEALGEIAGKWLRFCLFVRKWFPRLWVFLPILAGVLFRGGNEATDALIRAATAWLTLQTGGG